MIQVSFKSKMTMEKINKKIELQKGICQNWKLAHKIWECSKKNRIKRSFLK